MYLRTRLRSSPSFESPHVSRSTPAARHRDFYRQLDAILRRIDEEEGLESMLTTLLEQIGDQVLGDQTGITSGRLYRRDGEHYVVVRSYGAKGKAILGTKVPASYPAFQTLDRNEVSYVFVNDSNYDSVIEDSLGVGNFAAFRLDPEGQYVAAFGIEHDAVHEEVMLTLNSLRFAILHRLREIGLVGQIREARHIQMSLLPAQAPDFEGFELAGKSIPAEEVGGDVYDFLPDEDSELLGIAIGDASGHGLPAALQARDVVTGLRMGVEKDLKISAVLRRLNRVIHRSGLTSRFVSLFFGEVERGGNLVYVNAGHEPGLLLRATGETELLRSTGIVLGPLAEASYRRELVHIGVGDTLLLYTDGVIERVAPTDQEEFGVDRLESVARESLAASEDFEAVPAAILDAVRDWGGQAPWADDATVVVLRRRARLPGRER